MTYITIDGDDVGRKIASCYISNDEKKLKAISRDLVDSTKNISNLLKMRGFNVLFCAADGVVASIETNIDFVELFESIQKLAPISISFSAGVGNSLREAYVALLAAKSNNKNSLYLYAEIASIDI